MKDQLRGTVRTVATGNVFRPDVDQDNAGLQDFRQMRAASALVERNTALIAATEVSDVVIASIDLFHGIPPLLIEAGIGVSISLYL